ncbi:MAG: hypothetical protein Q9207_003186 [Kuettlingeria erythrocarpa]
MPSPNFDTIPTELRLQIYSLLLADPLHPSRRALNPFSWPCPHFHTELPTAHIPCANADGSDTCQHLHAARRAPASLVRLNKAISNEYSGVFYTNTRWQLRIAADEGPCFVRTPDVCALGPAGRAKDGGRYLVSDTTVRDMGKWQLVLRLAMQQPRGEHDDMGYLIDEYNAGLRNARREMARGSLRSVQHHLRRWCTRMVESGVEVRELEVRVIGADLLDLRREEVDLLAPLRELSVAKGGKLAVLIHGEGFEGRLERGDKGFKLARRNREYALEVEKAIRAGKGTRGAVLRREIAMFGKAVEDTAAAVADDGYIYRFDAGITAARSKAQAALRCLKLGNSSSSSSNDETSLPEMIKRLAASYAMVEECVHGMAKAKEEGRKWDLIVEFRCTEAEAERIVGVTAGSRERMDGMRELEQMRDWFFVREEFRRWWPVEPKPVGVKKRVAQKEKEKEVDKVVWEDRFGSGFW